MRPKNREPAAFSSGFQANRMGNITYKDAGVDLDVYRESMSRIGRLLRRTHTPRVVPLDGGFAGLLKLDFDSPLFARRYDQPMLVSCCDGVGTKLKVATLANRHETIGIDLVAMSVNDAICCGAEPLLFLDYVAMSHDDPDRLEQIVEGISTGCITSDCVLLGGETAIMPDLYAPGDYDLAGFCVGVVERKRLIDGQQIVPQDRLVGIASSGLHSNGYSLVRKIVFDVAGLSVDDRVEPLGLTVGEALLEPTRIYARPLRKLLGHYKVKSVIHGVAHITGGGIAENLQRILPEGCQARLERCWPVPPLFEWLKQLGSVADDEMDRVFNLGIGLVLVVSPFFADSIQHQLADEGLESWQIGTIAEGPRSAIWK